MRWLRNILIQVLLIPVYVYKWLISPLTPASCRHVPSCSQYAIDALKMHGPFRGFLMATNRFLRCHPWGTHGYDPVPKFRFKKIKIPKGKTRPKENRLKVRK